MRSIRNCVLAVPAMALLAACGDVTYLTGEDASEPSATGVAPSADSQNAEWQPVAGQAYPYTGSHGEMICAEWERFEDGQRYVEAEFYHPDVMNAELDGQGVLGADIVGALKRTGLSRVSTCEQARNFIAEKYAYIERTAPAAVTLPSEPGLPPGTAAEAAKQDLVEKVAEGVNSSLPYVVRLQMLDNGFLGTCSGFLIGPRTLLTAAHCFRADGVWDIRIDHGRGPGGAGDASVNCISGGTSCSNPPFGLNAEVFRIPGFGGALDSAHDLAVVINKTPWTIPAGTAPFLPITASAPGANESYWIDGNGAHAATGSGLGIENRSAKVQHINDSFTGYWRDEVVKGDGRPCEGDSGSAAINTSRIAGSLVGPDLAIGIANNAQGVSPTIFCPSPGDVFRYSRIEDKLGFIDTTLQSRGLPACNRATTPGGWSFRFCF